MSLAGDPGRARLAVDIGGTFTDVVLEQPGGDRVTTKLLTTHDHPSEAVLNGIAAVLRRGGLEPAQVGLISHGTHELDATPQAGLRHRHRDLPGMRRQTQSHCLY